MRLSMLMRDTEYRDALVEMISRSDREILVEVTDGTGADRGSVILTDIRPEELDDGVLARLVTRTVFISDVMPRGENAARDMNKGIHRVFKYSGLSVIMTEVSLVYAEWTGNSGGSVALARSIAVLSESDLYSGERCRALARHIIYRHGGSVLIIPLSFINDHDFAECGAPSVEKQRRHNFAKLMYMISEGRDYPAEGFTFTDSYGVSYLSIPPGLNPAAYLDGRSLDALIRSLAASFDTVIFDIGTCLRRENIGIISGADDIVLFGSGRRIRDPSKIFGGQPAERMIKIDLDGGSDEALRMDELVSSIFPQIGEQDRTTGLSDRGRA